MACVSNKAANLYYVLIHFIGLKNVVLEEILRASCLSLLMQRQKLESPCTMFVCGVLERSSNPLTLSCSTTQQTTNFIWINFLNFCTAVYRCEVRLIAVLLMRLFHILRMLYSAFLLFPAIFLVLD